MRLFDYTRNQAFDLEQARSDLDLQVWRLVITSAGGDWDRVNRGIVVDTEVEHRYDQPIAVYLRWWEGSRLRTGHDPEPRREQLDQVLTELLGREFTIDELLEAVPL